ncbi:outer membrane transport energization protein TonB [Roseovarius mucosus DSM 17069]|uniref:Outer membrane transport energization protein TonB n=1 Tax=Roseovarius mucosus DSM 17069 TaxID=1288298 RepID=A0A0A0HHT2_9RHOB|nr:TonB family protein [Roseovarius mucosus]KGM86705.1 outer membrane transport energization protein TonB [Roseovarius mucosus DSM 17069]
MIRSSRFVLSVCAVTALGLHGAGIWASAPPMRAEVEGGAGVAEVTLGSSFADMVAGAARPVSEASVTPTVWAEDILRPARPEVAEPSAPQHVTEAATALPVAAAPAQDSAFAAPALPSRITAQTNAETGLQVSRRPEARPDHAAAPEVRRAEPEERAEVRRTSGSNADQTATRGSMTGHETATAKRQGRPTASQSAAEGNAAASTYPGQVMRHLARVPRPRADTRGAALVQFSISEGGRLASVRVARSSGSTRLDRAALTVVERAAPFPAPALGGAAQFFGADQGGVGAG